MENHRKGQGILISVDKIFELQDGLSKKHSIINKDFYLFIQESLEFCLNRNFYCNDSSNCQKNTIHVFELFYQEALSSLLVCYRVGLWGCTTDCYAVLRACLEALGFINQIINKGDFKHIYQLMDKGKLKKELIEKRVKMDKKLEKTIGKLSDLASHFTKNRIAQRVFNVNGKQFARVGFALYEKEGELPNRLGHLINTVMFALKILNEFYIKYHQNCITKEFRKKYRKLSADYELLADKLNKNKPK